MADLPFGFTIRLPGFKPPEAACNTAKWGTIGVLAILHSIFNYVMLNTELGQVGVLPVTILPCNWKGVLLHCKQFMMILSKFYCQKVVKKDDFKWFDDCEVFVFGERVKVKCYGSCKDVSAKDLANLCNLWGLGTDDFMAISVEWLIKLRETFFQDGKMMTLMDAARKWSVASDLRRELDAPHSKKPKYERPMNSWFMPRNDIQKHGVAALLGRPCAREEVACFRSAATLLSGKKISPSCHIVGLLGLKSGGQISNGLTPKRPRSPSPVKEDAKDESESVDEEEEEQDEEVFTPSRSCERYSAASSTVAPPPISKIPREDCFVAFARKTMQQQAFLTTFSDPEVYQGEDF